MTDDNENGPLLWFNAEEMLADRPRSPQRRLAKAWARHRINRAAAHGMFVTFVSQAFLHLKDDNMAAVSDDVLEQWVRWEGTPGAGAKALRKVLQTKDGLLDWDMLRPWVRRTDPYAPAAGPRLKPPLR